MRNLPIALLSVIYLLSLGACERPAPSVAKSAAAEYLVVQDINQIETRARLAAANNRIDEVEPKVGEMEATPEKLDLDLLSQRVTALEGKTSGDTALVPEISPGSGVPRSASGARRAGSEPQRAPTQRLKLNLPELENRLRLAAPAEAKSFSLEK
jgi:hypothetical protein